MRSVPLRRAAVVLAVVQLALTVPGAAPVAAAVGNNPISVEIRNDLQCRVDHVLDWPDTAFYGFDTCATMLAVGDTPATSRLFSPGYFGYGSAPGPREGWTYAALPWSGVGLLNHGVSQVIAGDTGVFVTQVDSYTQGEERYRTDITLTAGSTAARGVLYRTGQCFFANGTTRVDATTTYPSPMCTKHTGPNPPHIQWIPLGGPANYAAGSDTDVWAPISAREPFPDTCTCTSGKTAAGLSWSWDLAPGESVTFSHLTDFGGHRDPVGTWSASPDTLQPGET
ncbi:MAG TPA: hypothetical protein VNA20_16765 [Frankiaceae bacterium]|nr:hypothetical protein [Frankiaceae bacterium]